jgi:AcrR family transcriptional regulator
LTPGESLEHQGLEGSQPDVPRGFSRNPDATGERLRRPRGRPRGFDREWALDRALEIFWARGYAGASIADLTAAMQINPPSLYAAFGDKRQLYLAALDRYQQHGLAALDALLAAAPDTRSAIAGALRQMVCEMTRTDRPSGCMVVLSGLHCGSEAADLEPLVAARRAEIEARLLQRIRRGVAAGDVAATVDPVKLAGFYATLLHGLSVQARSGVAQARLLAIVETALSVWPEDGLSGSRDR